MHAVRLTRYNDMAQRYRLPSCGDADHSRPSGCLRWPYFVHQESAEIGIFSCIAVYCSIFGGKRLRTFGRHP